MKNHVTMIILLLLSLTLVGLSMQTVGAPSPGDTLMPDGKPFQFWDDTTRYVHVYHVAKENPKASDNNPGTDELPFATISKAASVLKPGEKVIIHKGIYREWVRPARGGEGPDRMICYEAAQGEEVRIRGSEEWKPEFVPSRGWLVGDLRDGKTHVWMADLPAKWFVGYNPFNALNYPQREDATTPPHLLYDFQKKRGMVFANGRQLKQVVFPTELAQQDVGTFWVEPPLRLHVRLWGDADPKDYTFEVTTKEQVFAPSELYLGYIRLSGLIIEYAADGYPVPQKGMVSAMRGHHWIVEDCRIQWANAIGMDLGHQTWYAGPAPAGTQEGHHVIRRNTVSDCGICGMSGAYGMHGSLIEDNLIENISGRNVEAIWEAGGIKFIDCDSVLIRRNVIRHVKNAPGIWLDFGIVNCRITQNVIADVATACGGIYLEVTIDRNLIDHNILWDIKVPAEKSAIVVDTGDNCIVANNLIGNVDSGYAIRAGLDQALREVRGRYGLCRRHRIVNNVLVNCPLRIFLSRREDNIVDGNLYDSKGDGMSFCLQFPYPEAKLNLAGWQEYFGLDKGSSQVAITAQFDAETLELTITIDGDLPACVAVPELSGYPKDSSPGPFPMQKGKQTYRYPFGPRRLR